MAESDEENATWKLPDKPTTILNFGNKRWTHTFIYVCMYLRKCSRMKVIHKAHFDYPVCFEKTDYFLALLKLECHEVVWSYWSPRYFMSSYSGFWFQFIATIGRLVIFLCTDLLSFITVFLNPRFWYYLCYKL